MKENNGIRSLAMVAVALMMLAITVAPAAALTTLPYKNCFISVENDAGVRFNLDGATYNGPDKTYYMKFGGGGLNALHITDSPSLPYGQVTSSTSSSGTFYVSDTGGRGYDDDIILMFATNSSDNDFTLAINSSGYQWTPTGDGSIPVLNPVNDYVAGALSDTFTNANFTYGYQINKPSSVMVYPIFYGQNMSDTNNTFRFMFIDLNVGALGVNSSFEGNGMAKVDYTLSNFNGFCAFNAYAWCNQSNQGQGISWTNRVADAGSSGYTVSL
jgi:hypothetical protein